MLNLQKNKGFSLAEMMVVMLMLSIIFAAAAPILTKRATLPTENNEIIPAGTIAAYGGESAPQGWLLCNGNSYSISGKYEKLYNSIKYIYGGSGASFNVPNLSGRTLVGKDSTKSVITGGSATILGAKLGEEKHLLSVNEIPSHRHSFQMDGERINFTCADGSSNREFGVADIPGYAMPYTPYPAQYTGYVGGGVSHNIIQPSFVVNFIIKY